MPTYTVSTHDTGDTPDDDWAWIVRATGVGKWGLRPILRGLYGQAYDVHSIAVDRED